MKKNHISRVILFVTILSSSLFAEIMTTKPYFKEREKVIEDLLFRTTKELKDRLKSYKYDINRVKVNGKIALQHAMERGCDIEKIKLLVQNGAEVEFSFQNDYYTPIHYAIDTPQCHKNNFEVIEFLIESGVFVDNKNCYDMTPLHLAVDNLNIEATELLLAKGANIDIRTKEGKAIIYTLVDKIRKPKFETINRELIILKLLLKQGAYKDTKKDDMTLLTTALTNSKNDTAKFLILQDADINPSQKDRINIPLITAILIDLQIDNYDMIKILLKNGADISDIDYPIWHVRGKVYPLILSMMYKKFDTAKLLIKNGAEVNIKSKGANAIFWSWENEETYKLLKKYGAREK